MAFPVAETKLPRDTTKGLLGPTHLTLVLIYRIYRFSRKTRDLCQPGEKIATSAERKEPDVIGEQGLSSGEAKFAATRHAGS
jgi:hypothetical protein